MPRIVVVIDSGVVQYVIADHDCELMVVDYDTEGLPDVDVRLIRGNRAYVYKGEILEVDPILLEEFWTTRNQPYTDEEN